MININEFKVHANFLSKEDFKLYDVLNLLAEIIFYLRMRQKKFSDLKLILFVSSIESFLKSKNSTEYVENLLNYLELDDYLKKDIYYHLKKVFEKISKNNKRKKNIMLTDLYSYENLNKVYLLITYIVQNFVEDILRSDGSMKIFKYIINSYTCFDYFEITKDELESEIVPLLDDFMQINNMETFCITILESEERKNKYSLIIEFGVSLAFYKVQDEKSFPSNRYILTLNSILGLENLKLGDSLCAVYATITCLFDLDYEPDLDDFEDFMDELSNLKGCTDFNEYIYRMFLELELDQFIELNILKQLDYSDNNDINMYAEKNIFKESFDPINPKVLNFLYEEVWELIVSSLMVYFEEKYYDDECEKNEEISYCGYKYEDVFDEYLPQIQLFISKDDIEELYPKNIFQEELDILEIFRVDLENWLEYNNFKFYLERIQSFEEDELIEEGIEININP